MRPWGNFQVLGSAQKFKAKHIVVNPNSQLSYQSHTKRAEHWIFFQGQGVVILDDREISVGSGVHVHIPLGAKHRVRNTGVTSLEFVEVQLGSYFGEDDITRYEDDYQRV